MHKNKQIKKLKAEVEEILGAYKCEMRAASPADKAVAIFELLEKTTNINIKKELFIHVLVSNGRVPKSEMILHQCCLINNDEEAEKVFNNPHLIRFFEAYLKNLHDKDKTREQKLDGIWEEWDKIQKILSELEKQVILANIINSGMIALIGIRDITNKIEEILLETEGVVARL